MSVVSRTLLTIAQDILGSYKSLNSPLNPNKSKKDCFILNSILIKAYYKPYCKFSPLPILY